MGTRSRNDTRIHKTVNVRRHTIDCLFVRTKIEDRALRVVIAGAGPAGSSLAIRLADQGFDVTLIERDRFPRHKLCGEFISPESLAHFQELGVRDGLLSLGGQRIYKTRFSDRKGRSFVISSGILDGEGFALSLSRYEMDRCLMNRAKALGVRVLEGTRVANVMADGKSITGVEVVGDERETIIADLYVDATGRASALRKLADRKAENGVGESGKPLAIAFKAHLKNVRIEPGTCEIFFFPGGYGGLTSIEAGLANLCFMMNASKARELGADADVLLRKAVCQSRTASSCLESADRIRDWLAVSISSFGRTARSRMPDLLSAGDAAAFIDPFTGSGMLMALEGSKLLAETIRSSSVSPASLQKRYDAAFARAFGRRLHVCSILRRAAFLPVLPSMAISLLGSTRRGRNYLAGATRSQAALG